MITRNWTDILTNTVSMHDVEIVSLTEGEPTSKTKNKLQIACNFVGDAYRLQLSKTKSYTSFSRSIAVVLHVAEHYRHP